MRVVGERLGPVEFLRRLIRKIREDDVRGLASQCAYAFVFSLFPFLIFVVSLAALLGLDPGDLGHLPHELTGGLPDEIDRIIDRRLAEIAAGDRTGEMTASLVLAAWAATAGAALLVTAVNRAYGVKERRRPWKRRLIALWLTAAGALLLYLPALYAVAGGLIARALARVGLASIAPAVDLLRWPLLAVGAFAWLMLLYRIAPETRGRWRPLSPGAVVSAAGLLATNRLLAVYLERTPRMSVVYGALGGFVALLLWLYLSSAALVIGAEVNAVLDAHRPPAAGPRRRHVPLRLLPKLRFGTSRPSG